MDCQLCGAAAAPPIVPVKPVITKAGTIVLPDDYIVCQACHDQQYIERYGFRPEDAPPSGPPQRLPLEV